LADLANEKAVQFSCGGDALIGVLHVPSAPIRRGVVIITGGPQYRVGSHRQFTLLARRLAARNIAVLRFDYRGMGDSAGESRSFEDVNADVRAAVDTFLGHVPELTEVVLWGLCDAASASLFYAYEDERVTGVVMLNPWVRSESGIAKAYLKHYYTKRIIDPELWRKLARGEFKPGEAAISFLQQLRTRFLSGSEQRASALTPFPERMLDGLRRFPGRVLVIISGNDLTAAEFNDLVAGSREWRTLLSQRRVSRRELAAANHTFAKAEWRTQVENWTLEWIESW
jgi:exosortase A-associated hydrolase 1